MRAFTGWEAPLLLLLLLSSSRPLSSSNESSWRDRTDRAMDSVSGFCSVGDAGANSRTCSVGERFQGCGSPPRGGDDDVLGHVRALGEVGSEYIVRFNEYRHAAEFRNLLEDRLEGTGRVWQWLERNNPASAFPTDFALVRIAGTRSEAVLAALRGLEFVKDVSPQMRFTRALMSESGENGESSGEFHEDFDPESKPPGRLRTKLSSEYEIQDGTPPLLANVSLNHGRKLLFQVTGFLLG